MLRIYVYFIVVSLGGLIGAVAGAAASEHSTHVLFIILLEVFVSTKVLLFHINNLIFKYFIHDYELGVLGFWGDRKSVV
jgi:hypothetical protein